MSQSQVLVWICAVVTGLLLVPVRLVLAFFPFFNVTEILVFGGICFLLAIAFKPNSWLWALVVAAPTCWQVLRIVRRLGFDRISNGIGTGHALSLVLIPLAACCGAAVGRKLIEAKRATSHPVN